jgi:hypothetical protein
MQRPQLPGGTADPVGQRRAVQTNALARKSGPGIQRLMSAYLDAMTWATVASVGSPPRLAELRRLDDAILTRSAAVFGPDGDEHPELRRHPVEPLALRGCRGSCRAAPRGH